MRVLWAYPAVVIGYLIKCLNIVPEALLKLEDDSMGLTNGLYS